MLEGSYKNIELVIVNDGSSDNTKSIIESLAENDNRVVAFSWENKGVSAARNKGMEIANGEYIAFVDSDDYLANDMYEKTPLVQGVLVGYCAASLWASCVIISTTLGGETICMSSPSDMIQPRKGLLTVTFTFVRK